MGLHRQYTGVVARSFADKVAGSLRSGQDPPGACIILSLFLLLTGCQGCTSCHPSLPPTNKEDTQPEETAVDSEDSFDTVDTSPPPPCAQEEVEPNNNGDGSDANWVDLERWACGTLHYADFDYFRFEVPEPCWIKMDMNAASRGSAADPYIVLDSENGERVTSMGDVDSTDPFVIFPVEEADEWVLMVKDFSSQDPGDDYHYEWMATVTKAPVTWTHNEDHTGGEPLPWASSKQAMVLEEGMVVFGRASETLEEDWYLVQPPSGKHEVIVTVTAFAVGSPMDARMKLYDSDATLLEIAHRGTQAYDRDPVLTRNSDGDEDWWLIVREEDGASGGSAYWYTIEVEFADGE